MSDPNVGLGWLPVEAREDLEDQRDRASEEEADRLVALDPRARVLDLLARAACRDADGAACAKLRPAALRRVLDSFPGGATLDAADLAARFPSLVEEGT
ncbi:hypothetical protein [Falsiroseomonas sp. CW058]|uniref:hypothetical protein n=1 Tax=Falsiroseomonas sp. CW058 TaxID=3388664 RepID=UPI003D321976